MNSPTRNARGSQSRSSFLVVDFSNQRRSSITGGLRGSVRSKRANSNKAEFSERVKKLARKMMFRVKLYLMMNKAKKQVKSHLDLVNPAYGRLIRVLQNHFRSNANAEFVLEYLKQLSFFANFIRDLGDVSETAVTELCKCVKYEYMPAGTIVFKEGDLSNNKFYVILKGSVSVVKRTDGNVFVQQNRGIERELTKKLTTLHTKFDLPSSDHSSEESKDSSFSSSSSSSSSESDDSADSETQHTLSNVNDLVMTLGTKLSDMKEGEGFGEKALLAKNSKRTASIVTNANCDFLVMMKKDYIEIITKYDKRRQAKMKFMTKSIPYLDVIISTEIIENLFYLIKEVDFPKGSVVVNEGASGKNIFFIHEGYCDIEKVLISEVKATKDSPTLKLKRKLATFGPGSCLGEEVLLNSNPKYDYTIVASSSTVKLYSIDKNAFLSRFPRESSHAILEAFQSKEVVHQEKIKKLSENLHNLVQDRPPEPVIKPDNLTHLMRSSFRNSIFSHLRMKSNRAGDQFISSNQNIDSPLRSHDPFSGKFSGAFDDSPRSPRSPRSPKQPMETYFGRGNLPNLFHERKSIRKSFRGGPDNTATDNTGNSHYNLKVFNTDEIIQTDSPRSRSRSKGVSSIVTQSPMTATPKRLEISISDRRQSKKKLQVIGSHDISQDKKILIASTSGSHTERLYLEKFDFGTPTNLKTTAKRFSIRQEKKNSGNIPTPQRSQYSTFEAYYTRAIDSPHLPKEPQSALTPRTASGSSFKIKGLSKPIAWNKPSLLANEKKIESKRMAAQEKEVKVWSIEDIDPKFANLTGRFGRMVTEVSGRNDPDTSKKSIREIEKGLKEAKRSTSRRSLHDKRKMNDSLNQKKQREKFTIRLLSSHKGYESARTRGNDSLDA